MKTMTKIVLTGPESTGKSVLTRYLGAAFHAPYQYEYARTYLELRQGHPYTFDDLREIAHCQFFVRDRNAYPFRPDRPIIFCDTDAVVLQIWAQEKFGAYTKEATEDLKKHPADLYLLCQPDIAWVPDPLRENPDDRDRLFIKYRRFLERHHLNYAIVSGEGEERFRNAAAIVEKFLGYGPEAELKPGDAEAFMKIRR